MTINITPENIYMSITCLLLVLQVWQYYKLDKAQKEINKIWDQISTFNTVVALKILENQKEIDKLKENKKD
jgi:cell division protein FtsX